MTSREAGTCSGSFVGSQYISAGALLQVLGWDLQWHDCGETFGYLHHSWVAVTADNDENCPTTGFTYRALSVHGGQIVASSFDLNHFPVVSPSIAMH